MAISPDHAMIGGGGESPADFKVTPTLILKIRKLSDEISNAAPDFSPNRSNI